MQEQPLQEAKIQQKEHRFLPRFTGIAAGIASGILMGKYLLNKALHIWVVERIHYGKDPIVVSVRNEIENDLKKSDGPLGATAKNLNEIQKKFAGKKEAKLKVEKEKVFREINSAAESGIKPTAGALKDAENAAIAKVEANYRYFYGRAKGKIINEEIIKRMGLSLRMSEGRRWLFAGSAVTLGVVGYATYKIADHMLNGKAKTHGQAVINRRTSETPGTIVS